MILLTDFFSSEMWHDINNRVFLTFGFSGIGTVANALPATIAANPSSPGILVVIIQVLTAISYFASILVATTILCRFTLWYKDRNKKNK